MVALVLCVFLGYLGVHRFYLRQRGMGLLYLLTVGCFLLGWVHDLAMLLSAALRWGRVKGSLGDAGAARPEAGIAGPELWTVIPDMTNGTSRPHDQPWQRDRHFRDKNDAFDPVYVDPEVSETFPGYEPPDAEELYLEHEERSGGA